jgi:hypothetical protein
MKTILSLTAFLCFGWAATAQAQTAHKVEDKVETGAKKVAHKTAEVASKGESKVTDQVYKDATGPAGETVYIDNHDRYYWVDKKGHRQYVAKTDLKAKE